MAKRFFTKVAGVTHKNPDGIERQFIIEQYCRKGMPVYPIHETDNPKDPNAIALWVRPRVMIFFRADLQIGYLSADLASQFVERVSRGQTLSLKIADVTGGRKGQIYGVNLQVDVE